MAEGITVLSLFDGISCGRIALERADIKVDKYYASEIKKIAIETTMLHYPDTVQIGDVTKVRYENGVLYTEKGDFNVRKIDLLIGGSPCQDFSILRAASGLAITGLGGMKSRLFYEYLRLLREVNPRFFLLENVKMKKESEKTVKRVPWSRRYFHQFYIGELSKSTSYLLDKYPKRNSSRKPQSQFPRL